jgi:aromatic-L-amino-acid decarboxylase
MSEHVSFDPSAEDMRAMGNHVIDTLAGFIAGQEGAPASDMEGAYELAASLRRSPPDEGEDFKSLVDTVMEAASKAYNTAGPGYLAYIPGGGLYASALADLIACVTNRFTNLSAPAPALVQLEANVVRWLCDEFSLPPGSQGVLTSGGSMANFSAIVTARTAKLPENFLDGTIYISEHVHHSNLKSAQIAGFPHRSMRRVPCMPDTKMDVQSLRAMIAADRSEGAQPFLVIGSAGTVNAGAVDDLNALADIAAEENLWFHVDGAYGGFFRLTDEGKRILSGVERADSVTLDPHKGMFLPYGTGSLLVRDGEALRSAHQVEALYLPEASQDAAIPDFADYTPELSRDFRGLRVWLPLHLHGVNAFRRALEEKLELARLVYEELARVSELDVPWEPDLSIVAFRPKNGGNAAARSLLKSINDSKRIYLSPTEIDGTVYLRVCVLSHRTDVARIEEAIDIIKAAATG